ncbi:MAG: hypothetical protein ACK5OA_13405 [Acidovorax sp.]
MLTYKYEELAGDFSQLVTIAQSGQPFCIEAEGAIGKRMQSFIKNENNFKASKKSIMDRWRYIWGGMQAVHLPNFLPIWNRAIINGYVPDVVQDRHGSYKCTFTLKSAKSL